MNAVTATRIDEPQRRTLAALADVLVPEAEGMPAASAAGVAGAGLDQVLAARPDLRAPLERLLALAAAADPRDEVNRLAADTPDAFATLALVVTGAYYLDPEVRRRIGYPGQVPNPAAPGEAEHDLRGGLLDPVLARGPIYRATPGGHGGAAGSMALPHPSYPGHFGLSLSPAASATLGAVADALIPAGDGFPSATDAGVVAFVSDHMTPAEQPALETLLDALDRQADLDGSLRELERDRPADILVLVSWVYQAYWCSDAALAALRRSGSDYHGAPQPFGYALPPFELRPTTPRGGYIPTAEVRRVGS